jgi:hypothetical protein
MFAEHALGAAILRRAGLRRGMPMYGVLPNNGLGWVNGGTCTVDSGVVTRTGGEPFFWGSNDDYLYRITIDGTEYSIDRTETMTADQVTLEDTSVTEASDVAWHIIGGVGIARTIYAMCATRAYGDTGQVRSGSQYMPAVAQDLSDIYRVLTANLADIDTADASGVTAREYMERAKAEGSLWVPYAHRIETSPTTSSDAYLTYWQELIALAASYVSSGDAVVWNWDQLYAYYGQQAFDHTYYGKLSEGAW